MDKENLVTSLIIMGKEIQIVLIRITSKILI